MEYNIVTAELDPRFPSRTVPLYQYDYGQKLVFTGVELPDAYEVHFSNEDTEGTAKVRIGTSEGVEIPDEYLLSGEPIYVWVFLHAGESDGETEYKTVIPVHKRAQVENAEPTPVQQDVITQTIAALNTAVERAKTAQDAWESMSATAETLAPESEATASYENGVLTLGIPEGRQGDKGDEGNGIESTVLNPDYTLTINFTDGTSYTTESIRGAQGNDGDDGVGIASTVLNADYTLTITLTDGTSYTTPSIRGEKGDTGRVPQITAEKSGSTTTIYADGVAIGTVEDGEDGEDGIGVPTGGTAGQVLTKKSTADGDTEWQDASGGTVTDVTVNGVSVLDGGVAKIPLASTNNQLGVVSLNGNNGINAQNGILRIVTASAATIKNGTNIYTPITASNQHNSTFYGLAKASGDTTQSQSSNPVGTYTDSAKASIKAMLGISGESQTITVSGTEPVISAVSNARYVCGELTSLTFTPSATGICDVIFSSGTTATVLNLPNTVILPEWFEVEANHTYEISIVDGVYGAVMVW